MNREYEDLKLDIGLTPQSIASANVTGKYFNMKEFRTALAILIVGNITAGGSAALQIMEAKNEAALSAQALSGKLATILANVKVAKMTITCASGTTADTVIITVDGVAYTFTGGASEDKTIRQYDASGDDTADAVSLTACINDPVYGVLGIVATSAVAVITMVALDGYYIEAVSSTGGHTTFATTSAIAYVWLEGLDLTDLFSWVACKVTTASNTGICGAVLIRGKSRKAIEQKVGAKYPA